jgi:hypothetical protein
MAVTVRARRTAYDNIAAGSATGRELTIAGDTASNQEVYGGGYVNSTSNNERHITNLDAAGTSVSNTAPGPENMTAAVDPTDENVG